MESVILPYLLMSTVTAVRTETIETKRGIEGGGGVPLQPLRLTDQLYFTN